MRNVLGDLWLTWYVHRSDPRRVFSVPIAETVEDARQLRVRDMFEDARIWEALSEPDANAPGHSHTGDVERYVEQYRGVEVAVLVLPAMVVPEGYVLVDGMHRAC